MARNFDLAVIPSRVILVAPAAVSKVEAGYVIIIVWLGISEVTRMIPLKPPVIIELPDVNTTGVAGPFLAFISIISPLGLAIMVPKLMDRKTLIVADNTGITLKRNNTEKKKNNFKFNKRILRFVIIKILQVNEI